MFDIVVVAIVTGESATVWLRKQTGVQVDRLALTVLFRPSVTGTPIYTAGCR